jgi:hypothetical protein
MRGPAGSIGRSANENAPDAGAFSHLKWPSPLVVFDAVLQIAGLIVAGLD